MHRGCFVWTPTPPLSGRRTRRPGPARVCVCVPCLAGSGGPASRARFGAPHLFFGRSCFALCLFGPLRAGVALFVVVVGIFLIFFCFSSPSPPRCAPVVSCFACFPAWGALGLGVLFPRPPSFSFLAPPPLPVVSGVSCFPVALGLCAPPPPPFFFPWFLDFSFSNFFSFFFCRLCGAGRVCVSWAVGCASVVLSLSLLCVRWLVLCGVGRWAGLSYAVSW